jgi:parvulin-like peptidyl-prolyl isomerase
MAFSAAIATAVTLGACGSGLPGDAVAQIGAASITKAQLDHWLTVANDSSQVSNGTKASPTAIPPDFTACIAAQRKSAGTTSSSETSTFKSVCQSEFQTDLNQALPYLIETVWVQADAVDRHLKVTDKQVETAFDQERKTSTPSLATNAELKAFLTASGQTVADLRWRTYVGLLTNKIELAVQKKAQKVSNAKIAAYYHKNISQYTVPSTRDLHLVLTSTLASAQKVRSLLAGGESYATVASKYSIDTTTKKTGGKMTGVSSSELTPLLSDAVFKANVGALSGPVKTAFGYYVFTVDKATTGSVESLKKATPTIRATLSQQQVSAAETAWQNSLTKKWAAKTTCRSGYQVATVCSNPPPASSSGATG